MHHTCNHKTLSDHSRMVNSKRLWTCSNCAARGLWTESWGYFGNMECTKCWTANIEFVACSDECMKVLAEKHNLVDERAPKKPKDKATPKPKRKPAWQVKKKRGNMNRIDSKLVATSTCGKYEIKLGGDGELRCVQIIENTPTSYSTMQIGWTPSGKTEWIYDTTISPLELGYLKTWLRGSDHVLTPSENT